MPKHAEEPKKAVKFKQQLYDNIFTAILGLKEQAMAWWKESLESRLVCEKCDTGKGKKNKDGLCAYCNGTGYIPDKDQRNMAFKEVVARLSPAPKAVEMRIDDNRDKEELLQRYEKMPKEEVDQLLKAMDITVKGEAEYVKENDNNNDGTGQAE